MRMSSSIKRQRGRAQVSPRISDAEWAVMKVLWQRNEATFRQVVEALANQAAWKPKTIHTLLSRLVQKGVLANEKSGREYVFKPLVSEQASRLAASRSFLAKVFDGEIAPFLACFLEREKLSRKEIEELKNILEDKTP
jgi:BlaI family penicillinase repressor